MKKIITKELLSAVFGKQVGYIDVFEDDYDTHNSFKVVFQFTSIYYGGISGIEDEQINIYELAHKCKVKASEYGYRMMSCQDKDGGYCEVMEAKHYPPMLHSELLEYEYDAVFKCFQWILDNKEQQ